MFCIILCSSLACATVFMWYWLCAYPEVPGNLQHRSVDSCSVVFKLLSGVFVSLMNENKSGVYTKCFTHLLFLFPRQVVIGWDLLEQMEKMPTINQRPVDACRIRECGVWTP